MDFEQCREAFERYISDYDLKDPSILLKYHHSYQVSELMAELAFRLNLSKEEIIVAKVIGLLHDLGRFEQLKKFHSYSDFNIDHADESCVYLFEKGHIRDFIEDDIYDAVIEKAIHYYNKYDLPKLEGKELLFSNMIRDMDKVDIYKQVAVNYETVFDADQLSEGALKQFKQSTLIDRKNIKSKSDDVLEMLGFIFDINFDESYDILVSTDNFDLFLSTVKVMPNSEKLWKKLREICFDRINQGVVSGQ